MNLKEIYTNYKKALDDTYAIHFHQIMRKLDKDTDIQSSDDEINDLIIDLMLSNILGEIVTYDDVKELLAKKAKRKIPFIKPLTNL